MADKSKPGLWANIHAKKQRGEAPAKPGDKDYPDAKNWKKVTNISEKKGTAAWQKSEGKNPEGGLNEKGRASLKAQGHDIKRPQPEGGSRKDSFCARMKGMKSKLTSSETANDPDSRINKSLRKWKCGSAYVGDYNFLDTLAMESSSMSNSKIVMNAFGMRPLTKQANPILDYITSAPGRIGESALGMYNSMNPHGQRALLGGLIGGGVGGVGNAIFGNKEKSLLNRLGVGALGGAAVGAGGTALGSYAGEKLKDPISKGIKKIREEGGKLSDKAVNKAKELKDKAVEGGKYVGERASEAGEKVKGGLKSVGQSVSDTAGKLKNKANELMERFKGKGKEEASTEETSESGSSDFMPEGGDPRDPKYQDFLKKKGSYRGFQKEALMGAALDFYKSLDPTAQAAILGGGGGAVLGGLGNALFGKRKSGVGILGRLGRGALAGGALGGLAGAGINEGALRLGMHGAGASDRGYHLAATRGASGYNGSQLPTDLANDYISGLANKINYPEDVQPR